MQAVFQDEQLRPLRFEHSPDRNAGPKRDDFGDFLRPDDLTQQLFRRRFSDSGSRRVTVRRGDCVRGCGGVRFCGAFFLFLDGVELFLQVLNLRIKLGQPLKLRVVDRLTARIRRLNARVQVLVFELFIVDFFAQPLRVADAAFFLFPTQVQLRQRFRLRGDFLSNLGESGDGARLRFVDKLSLGDFQLR